MIQLKHHADADQILRQLVLGHPWLQYWYYWHVLQSWKEEKAIHHHHYRMRSNQPLFVQVHRINHHYNSRHQGRYHP